MIFRTFIKQEKYLMSPKVSINNHFTTIERAWNNTIFPFILNWTKNNDVIIEMLNSTKKVNISHWMIASIRKNLVVPKEPSLHRGHRPWYEFLSATLLKGALHVMSLKGNHHHQWTFFKKNLATPISFKSFKFHLS